MQVLGIAFLHRIVNSFTIINFENYVEPSCQRAFFHLELSAISIVKMVSVPVGGSNYRYLCKTKCLKISVFGNFRSFRIRRYWLVPDPNTGILAKSGSEQITRVCSAWKQNVGLQVFSTYLVGLANIFE